MVDIKQLRLGPIMTNCYIFFERDVKEAVIVDPAGNAAAIKRELKELGVTPVAILLTHGHADHIGAVDELRDEYKIKVYASKEEVALLLDPSWNLSPDFGFNASIKVDEALSDGQEISLGGMDIRCIHTPGHTPGGMCFYLYNNAVLFSGDTMFACSYGRTDFPGGSMKQLMDSIKGKLLTLPEDVKVLPGHDAPTSIGDEKKWY